MQSPQSSSISCVLYRSDQDARARWRGTHKVCKLGRGPPRPERSQARGDLRAPAPAALRALCERVRLTPSSTESACSMMVLNAGVAAEGECFGDAVEGDVVARAAGSSCGGPNPMKDDIVTLLITRMRLRAGRYRSCPQRHTPRSQPLSRFLQPCDRHRFHELRPSRR